MLDRYKKKGGFIQLLQLIETAVPKKQEQFLQIIASESPPWEQAIKSKMIHIQRVYDWPRESLLEVLTRTPNLTMAAALHGSDSVTLSKVLDTLPPISRRKLEDTIAEISPSPGEKHSAILRIITDIRGYFTQGVLRFEKVDPELIIADNIEEALNSTSWSRPVETQSAATHLVSLATPIGNDTALSAPPSGVSADNGDLRSAHGEIEFLKRKMNHLTSEVNSLRHENSVLKEKLDQIRRIA